MSRQQRIGLVALAAAVAAVAFLIARPGDDDETSGGAAATVQTEPASPDATVPDTTPTETTQPEPEPEPVRIRLEGGEAVGGVERIDVENGDNVRLTVTSDTPYEIHIHGYDIVENAGPGSPARFDFEADVDGVFEVEVEDTATQIAELRVEP